MNSLISKNRINFDRRNVELDFRSSGAPHDRIVKIKGKNFYVLSGSEYFDALFNNTGFSEANQEEIIIDDVLPEQFEMFLKFIYPCQLEITVDNYHILFSLAHRFMSTKILDRCHEFIAANYDQLDKLQLLELAFTFNIEEIKEDIAHILTSHSTKIGDGYMLRHSSFAVRNANNSINCIPVVSQMKSLILLAFADSNDAIRVQEDFANTCPVLSQIISVHFLFSGDMRSAWRIQKKFLNQIALILNAVPGIGLVKGAFQHFIGDHAGGDIALYSSTRTTAGLMMGFTFGDQFGPRHARIGVVLGGLAVDVLATGLKSYMDGKYTPIGICAAAVEVVKRPSIECIFDTYIEFFSTASIGGLCAIAWVEAASPRF